MVIYNRIKVMWEHKTENIDIEWKVIQRLNQISIDLFMTVMMTTLSIQQQTTLK